MKWDEYVSQKMSYQDVWQRVKNEHSGDMRKFLDRSYIVVCYRVGQVALDADSFIIARDHKDFFMFDRHSSVYMKLAEELKRAEMLLEGKKKALILKKLWNFDVSKLSVKENWAEVRFCTVDMPKIQLLKESKFCDQALTNKSQASIRIILKK